jgi:DNA-binding CsgD family transcriptional regulator
MRGLVRADDVRQVLRLARECRELLDSGQCASSHLLDGISQITRSQIAIQLNATGMRRTAIPIMSDVKDRGWASASDRDRIFEYVSKTRLDEDPMTAAMLARNEPIVTMTRSEAIPQSTWDSTELRNDVHRPAGIDDSLMSIAKRKRPGHVRVLVLKRGRGEPVFSSQEAEIVHFLHDELGWLFDATPANQVAPEDEWSAREREVFRLLLTGASEKCIAVALDLSVHTVHGYVKNVYRRVGVTSRAELMAIALERARSNDVLLGALEK